MQAIVQNLNTIREGEYITIDIKETGQQIRCTRVVETDGDASLSAIHISVDDLPVIKVGATKFYPVGKFETKHLIHAVPVADLATSDRFMNILRFLEPESIWIMYEKRKADNAAGVYTTLT